MIFLLKNKNSLSKTYLMNKLRKYYRKGDVVVKIDSRIINDATPWRKKDKFKITEVIKVGEYGVYWLQQLDIKNPELIIECQVGGYDVKDKKAYERWLHDCANQRLVNILSVE